MNQQFNKISTPGELDSKFPSLKSLIDHVSGKSTSGVELQPDSGLVVTVPFPFLAVVGQLEMKYALLMSLINPEISGVLLIGPRGTGKTTAIRGMVDLLPETPRSLCYYGCMPEDIEAGGIDAVCANCAKKYAMGEPLAAMDKVRLVELPLNARLEDVVGSGDNEDGRQESLRLHRGILAHADRNILLVDEVNLLADEVIDAILDAASSGSYTVKRGSSTATYRSRFSLIGTMNPEEGQLRPQIMDRFGLRIVVKGLENKKERFEAYKRVHQFKQNPHQLAEQYKTETHNAQVEIQAARDMLPDVKISSELAEQVLELVRSLNIDSLRAEITLFETAKAFAALDNRDTVVAEDVMVTAPMVLRMRRSQFMEQYLTEKAGEEKEISQAIASILSLPEGE